MYQIFDLCDFYSITLNYIREMLNSLCHYWLQKTFDHAEQAEDKNEEIMTSKPTVQQTSAVLWVRNRHLFHILCPTHTHTHSPPLFMFMFHIASVCCTAASSTWSHSVQYDGMMRQKQAHTLTQYASHADFSLFIFYQKPWYEKWKQYTETFRKPKTLHFYPSRSITIANQWRVKH